MANEEHLKILKQGVEAWNGWRAANPDVVPDLRSAQLSGAELIGANLREAILSQAQLRGAELRRANLSGADLGAADLTMADLNGADLSRTDLSWANLNAVDLLDADLSEASASYTTFPDVKLNTVKGIETIRHHGPSSIGIDTIYRSQGKIPLEFLRGAGVPDNFIEYMSSLVGSAFEFYSCFISYSSKDEEFARRIFADLQQHGVRCWFAPHHVQAGKKLHEQIDVAIRLHEKLLLILSPDSINSEWVKTEIGKARKRESQEKKRVLFPVRLNISYEQLQEWECFDADRGKDSACEIREYYIPDFTDWKDHDQYQDEFKKLVRDLKK
jgi:TIR domain/Pentapeptide repeats (8 copies)